MRILISILILVSFPNDLDVRGALMKPGDDTVTVDGDPERVLIRISVPSRSSSGRNSG